MRTISTIFNMLDQRNMQKLKFVTVIVAVAALLFGGTVNSASPVDASASQSAVVSVQSLPATPAVGETFDSTPELELVANRTFVDNFCNYQYPPSGFVRVYLARTGLLTSTVNPPIPYGHRVNVTVNSNNVVVAISRNYSTGGINYFCR